MNAKTDAFISEIRNKPQFVAASATDPKWLDALGHVEHLLNVIDRKANEDPQAIEILDKIQDVIARRDLSMKERLLEVGKLFAIFLRDAHGVWH